MERTIWKFNLPMADQFALEMPAGAELLILQTQDGEPRLWAMVDRATPRVPRRFAIYGTGHDIPEIGSYTGTFQTMHGFVWHLFDLGEDAP